MIDLVELKKLCDEYDDEGGCYQENEYEGKAFFEYVVERASKSGAPRTTGKMPPLFCSCGKVVTQKVLDSSGRLFYKCECGNTALVA